MESLEGLAVPVLGFLLAAGALAWLWQSSSRPSIIERLERSMVSNQTRLDAQEAETEDLKRQVHELHASRIADHALLQEWITYARRLAEMVRTLTGQEPPPEPAQRARTITSMDIARLARAIEARFSLEEIDGLAYDMGLRDVIAGDTIKARSQSLVDAARRRGVLVRLIELYREQRPEGDMLV